MPIVVTSYLQGRGQERYSVSALGSPYRLRAPSASKWEGKQSLVDTERFGRFINISSGWRAIIPLRKSIHYSECEAITDVRGTYNRRPCLPRLPSPRVHPRRAPVDGRTDGWLSNKSYTSSTSTASPLTSLFTGLLQATKTIQCLSNDRYAPTLHCKSKVNYF